MIVSLSETERKIVTPQQKGNTVGIETKTGSGLKRRMSPVRSAAKRACWSVLCPARATGSLVAAARRYTVSEQVWPSWPGALLPLAHLTQVESHERNYLLDDVGRTDHGSKRRPGRDQRETGWRSFAHATVRVCVDICRGTRPSTLRRPVWDGYRRRRLHQSVGIGGFWSRGLTV